MYPTRLWARKDVALLVVTAMARGAPQFTGARRRSSDGLYTEVVIFYIYTGMKHYQMYKETA